MTKTDSTVCYLINTISKCRGSKKLVIRYEKILQSVIYLYEFPFLFHIALLTVVKIVFNIQSECLEDKGIATVLIYYKMCLIKFNRYKKSTTHVRFQLHFFFKTSHCTIIKKHVIRDEKRK